MTKSKSKLKVIGNPKSVTIHKISEGWDDGDPLYEVDCTITFEDGTEERCYFDYIRAGQLHSLEHPRSKSARHDIIELCQSS